MNDKKIVGVFKAETEAIKVIESLKDIGYIENQISVIAKQNENINDNTQDKNNCDDDVCKMVGGAGLGGILGATGAVLSEFGVLAIPGIGAFLCAGPISKYLTQLIEKGKVDGGLARVLGDLGVDKQDAQQYEIHLNSGYILIAVDKKQSIQKQVMDCYKNNNDIIIDTKNNK